MSGEGEPEVGGWEGGVAAFEGGSFGVKLAGVLRADHAAIAADVEGLGEEEVTLEERHWLRRRGVVVRQAVGEVGEVVFIYLAGRF